MEKLRKLKNRASYLNNLTLEYFTGMVYDEGKKMVEYFTNFYTETTDVDEWEEYVNIITDMCIRNGVEMEEQIEVVETNMSDGIDLIHYFNTIEEAIESGRFDYISELFEDELEDIISDSNDVREFIENVGYPFSINN